MNFFSKILNPFATERKKDELKNEGISNASNESIDNTDTSDRTIQIDIISSYKSETPETETPLSVSDVGTLLESVRELIIDSIVPFTGKDDYSALTIWVNDQLYHIISREDFITNLRASFDSMHLSSLGSGEIKVKQGIPSPSDGASPIIKKGLIPAGKLWYRLIEKGKEEVKLCKASLSIYQGLGSCKEKEYILSSDDKSVYRIGRGVVSRKPGSTYRINDIIIEENNPDQNIQKLNNFVSSSQANIYLEKGGFYLKAMPSGCRTSNGSPTKIIRDQEPIELRDSASAYRLKDGDIIELGKSVLLIFKIIE